MSEERYLQSDLSPAVHELKKLHTFMLDDLKVRLGNAVDIGGFKGAYSTVISIIPGDRRREEGWYKYRLWKSKTDSMLHALDQEHPEERYHEVFIAGESLNKSPQELVFLMMHQICHQASATPSVRSYHSEWMKHWMQRLWLIPQEALDRDNILGWGAAVDIAKLPKDAKELIDKYAATLDPAALDLYRGVSKVAAGTGKMLLWYCDCKKAPRLRTGAIPHLRCVDCGTLVRYRDDPGKLAPGVYDQLAGGGYVQAP